MFEFMGIPDTALMAGANILGGLFGGNSANNTAQKQLDVYNQYANKAGGLFNQNISSYDPYVQAGAGALGNYQNLLSGNVDFNNDPMFKYQNQLLGQKMAKSRNSVSPSAMSVYSAPLIANEYSNMFNRISPLLNMGYSAVGAQAGQRGNLANLYMNQGQAGSEAYRNQGANEQYGLGSTMGNLTRIFAGDAFGGGSSGSGGGLLNSLFNGGGTGTNAESSMFNFQAPQTYSGSMLSKYYNN